MAWVVGRPAWMWFLVALFGGVGAMKVFNWTNTMVGAIAWDWTVSAITLVATLGPFIGAIIVLLAFMHIVHDHVKAWILGLGGGGFGLASILWNVGVGNWVLTHWLVRP